MLPTELWIKIALCSPYDEHNELRGSTDEHVFNSLARAIPALGRWTIAGHSGEIVSRRLDLMLAFGYSVEIASTAFDVYGGYWHDIAGIDHGCIIWMKDGRIHRNDGPAIVSAVGDHHICSAGCVARYAWQYHGQFHRVGGPSNENLNSCQSWSLHGEYCRYDGPTEMYDHSIISWYQDDDLHRVDGPAIIDSNGDIMWYVHHERHRNDGPATIDSDGKYEYYQHDERVLR